MNISEQQLNNMMSAVTTALQPLIQGGVPQTSADGDADVKMLMAMP